MPKDRGGDKNPSSGKEGEVIPPSAPDETRPTVYADIIAQFNQYTDRPDLFLEAVERHDPGFIKRMNADAEQFSKKNRNARFRFGQWQAYLALTLSVAAGLSILYCVYLLVESKQAGFWAFIGLALLYAVSQSGTKGFLSLIEGIKNIIKAPSGRG